MPAAIAVPAIATAVAGGAAAGASIYGAHRAGSANNRASAIQQQTDAQTLQLERERDAEAKRQWDVEQAFQAKQFASTEEERLHARELADAREARQAPYRAASAAAMGRLGDLLGLNGQAPTPGPVIAPVQAGNTLSFQRRPQTLGQALNLPPQ